MKRAKYLEIYPSEVAARKISKHLDKMLAVKPRMYHKTLLRYKELARILLECVAKIVRMLQSEVLLTSEDTEFQELVSYNEAEQIEELRHAVDSLGDLVEKKPSQESTKLSSDTLKLYRAVFAQAASHDFGYVEVNNCAKLLNFWMTKRFSGLNSNFKFQIRQLPVWATFIVIAYGKYHSMGQGTQFIEDFRSWCEGLSEDTSNCWALPYNVFSMTKVLDGSNFTMDALVIYDLLIDGCFYQLLDCKVSLDSSYIAKLVKEYKPDDAPMVRARFARQAELIETIDLQATAGVTEDVL